MQHDKQTQITVAGVSANPEKYGHRIFRDLLKEGYDVVGVNPKGGTILDQEVFESLTNIPRKTELLILVVPAEIGINIIREAKDLGITNIWLQPGAEGDQIVQYAQANNLNLTYNKCFMTDQGIW